MTWKSKMAAAAIFNFRKMSHSSVRRVVKKDLNLKTFVVLNLKTFVVVKSNCYQTSTRRNDWELANYWRCVWPQTKWLRLSSQMRNCSQFKCQQIPRMIAFTRPFPTSVMFPQSDCSSAENTFLRVSWCRWHYRNMARHHSCDGCSLLQLWVVFNLTVTSYWLWLM